MLEDTNGDGKMDKKTVFADKLAMPRALKVLDHGVLIGEPPNLWLMKDTDGDLKADTKDLVVNTYGNPNGGIEHNANSLFWAMDNIMYSSEHVWDLRWKNGKFESLPALSRGQWQMSQDDAGRIYRNVNDSPLFVDYTPSRYFLRNPNGARTRGLYELLIEQTDATVYPVRDNRGVNRGYRDPFFRAGRDVDRHSGRQRADDLSRRRLSRRSCTATRSSPTRRPISCTAWCVTDDGSGRLTAKNGYAQGEFLASSDERFRPVSLVRRARRQHVRRRHVPRRRAGRRHLERLPDRLHQVARDGTARRQRAGSGASCTVPAQAQRPAAPALSKATPQQLVQTLSNPKGWWRDTAQRLLVERGDTTVAPALKTLAASAPDWRTQLHALWTLDGLDAIEVASGPEGPRRRERRRARVGGAAVGALARPGSRRSRRTVLKLLDDKNWNVRRQVAASIGEMPAADARRSRRRRCSRATARIRSSSTRRSAA